MRLLLLPWALLALLAGAGAGIPPHEDAARVARYVVHQCDWARLGALATLSARREPLRGRPFANVFSLSDGPPGPRGSGVPYLYLTALEVSVQDLQVDANASLTVSLAQTPYCKKRGYDPQNPLCAHIIFSGTVDKVNETEAVFAKLALFSRHPEMASWPRDHNWFFAKFNITNIWVLDYFGGLKTVTPQEYYNVTP
ncbi:LOW QUALITY PROTEIN: protein CREG1 [Chelonoidis abingdonii]|uniref:LOW QUALITY PROTEIN: protein CREG1 n=1 Tax=Chelonoidis abingdonii TaxID=106734 RepID=UPI003F49645C